MGLKASLSLPFAKWISKKNYKWALSPVQTQQKTLRYLLKKAENTQFGKDHNFNEITTYNKFKSSVPVRTYEDLNPYIDLIKKGQKDILWPGKPIYLSKTSGTTSGAKYIPITKASIPYHIKAARDAILHYIAETQKTDFVDGKMIFLQGSPELDKSGAIPVGRLSGIVAHHVPAYLQKNRLPSFKTNSIVDWEEKVSAICMETMKEKMSLISGIPPWVQMYFEELLRISGEKNITSLFPDFSLFIYGGVNYEPYKRNMEKLIGKSIDGIELYPASEGFIAFQDQRKEKGMLLLLNSGIFYEFIPADEFYSENPSRLSIKEVKLGVNYVIILNTNAGLWGYNIGDTIKFVSLHPHRIVVTGRIKHFTSAFGEHVIAEEVEKAMAFACKRLNLEIQEFHLAPQVEPKEGLPYHEWFVEANLSDDIKIQLSQLLNDQMINLNPYYKDLIEGSILKPLEVKLLPKNSFNNYMKSIGKLGGQNKLPRLANDRKIADSLI